ncbi:hypothetical protein ACJ41O_005674 [Fusarium nematophilum]
MVAFVAFAGGLAAGIVVPSKVEIGHVARVDPSTVFYPVQANGPDQILKQFGLQAPAIMRSLGSVEAAKVTLRKEVSVEYNDRYPATRDKEAVASLTYGYSLTGVDMGLQKASELKLVVDGFCMTEYGWVVDDNKNEDKWDLYELWGEDSQQQVVYVDGDDIYNAPKAAFFVRPKAAELVKESNVSYAVLIHSAHRASISRSSDPWYATEERRDKDEDGNAEDIPYDANLWMKRQRPVLSCWEQNRWTYQGQDVESVYKLREIQGIKIKEVILDVLQAALGGGPMIARLGNACGDSALRSRTTSPKGVIDAEASSMYSDMERLILAAYVASRSIFTDATMYGVRDDYRSIFSGSDGEPRDGSDDFVVSSPNITTFSLNGIIAVTSILGILMLANFATWMCLKLTRHSPYVTAKNIHGYQGVKKGEIVENAEPNPASSGNSAEKAQVDGNVSNAQEEDNDDVVNDKWTRYHVLTAGQLFRCLYEVNGMEADWSCERLVPLKEDNTNFKLLRCRNGRDGRSNDRCRGHIKRDTDPEVQDSTGSDVDADGDDNNDDSTARDNV